MVTAKEFWSWLAATEQELRWPPDARVCESIGERLHSIDSGLGFEVARRDDKIELAISASGDAARFPLVAEIVAAAPPMDRVRVVAFRQRGPIASYLLQAEGRSLSSDDIWFALERDAQGLGLRLFVRDFVDGDGERQESVYLLLDNALGEFDMVQNLAWIIWAALPPDPRATGLSPLIDLPSTFDGALGRQ